MKVIYTKLPRRRLGPCVATIGAFDGIHLGHRYIFDKVTHSARKYKLPSLVISFDRPPRFILSKKFPGCITAMKEKERLIAACGIDYLWLLESSAQLLNMSGREFISYIFNHFSVREFIVGDDFRFGRGAGNSIESLKLLAREFNFRIKAFKRKTKNGNVVSSSLIRELIAKGKIDDAGDYLARDYLLAGEVVAGAGFGRRLGFPTANILIATRVVPPRGVYAACVYVNNKKYPAGVNIGFKPTTNFSDIVTVEAHLVGFSGNMLGKTIAVKFFKKIRDEKKFKSSEDLRRNIQKDLAYVAAHYSLTRDI